MKKLVHYLKGAVLALLLVAGIQVLLARLNVPLLVGSAAAAFAGIVMIVNTVLELVETFLVEPADSGHAKWFGWYKCLSFVLSAFVPVALLTSAFSNIAFAQWSSVVVITLVFIADVVEAILQD